MKGEEKGGVQGMKAEGMRGGGRLAVVAVTAEDPGRPLNASLLSTNPPRRDLAELS